MDVLSSTSSFISAFIVWICSESSLAFYIHSRKCLQLFDEIAAFLSKQSDLLINIINHGLFLCRGHLRLQNLR